MTKTGSNNDEILDAESYWRWVELRRLTNNTDVNQQKTGRNPQLPTQTFNAASKLTDL